MRGFISVVLILLSAYTSIGQINVLEFTSSSSNSLIKYEKFEVEIRLNHNEFNNPYDENEIDVEVEFVNSGEHYNVDAFWYQPFDRCYLCPDPTIDPENKCTKNPLVNDPNYLTPINTLKPWRARFSPPRSGTWKYRVKVKFNEIETVTPYKSVSIANSTKKGFINVNDNLKNFSFENDEVFFPIGMNVVHWGNKDIYNRLAFKYTKNAIQKISENGGNLIRIWMGPKQFEIEWGLNSIGNYDDRQNRAFDLDHLIEYAESKGVYVQLCLEAHIQFQVGTESTDLWYENPYKSLLFNNEDQDDFFTKEICKDYYKRKLRYIMSRWGYSTAIFAFEMFNEVDGYRHGEENEGFWVKNNYIKIRQWHDEMIEYAKEIDLQNHLFTTSTASISAGDLGSNDESLWGSNLIDFTQNHHYGSDYNVEYQRNYLAQRSNLKYNKPNLLGEYGDGFVDCWLSTSNFTSDNYTEGNYFHSVIEMHNTIWSSSFSGSSGAGLYWWANHVFNECWGGQYQYFKSLSMFFDNVNVLSENYKAISNNCQCKGKHDISQNSECGGVSENNCFPIDHTCEDSPNSDYITDGISTSNDCKLEVFGLMDKNKIIGWLHNKDNYWYKVPHNAGPDNVLSCEQLDDNQPTSPTDIQTLQNETITIINLPCDGNYKVEFYSTYPEYDIDGDSENEDGGIIPSFTINNIGVHCGKLTFTVPKLQALGNPPYAPDYAFKITKKTNSWSNKKLIENQDFNINGNIASNENNIFYEGTDNRLHHYWYSNGQWNHEWLTNWNNDSQNVEGDIAFYDGDVFYEGTDNRLHHYWYSNGQWNHEWLTDWSNNSQNVGGDIAYYDGDVFYKGTDNRLHHYWYGNGQWNHEWLTDWSNNLENVGNSISVPRKSGIVFYEGLDNRLHQYYLSNGLWKHKWITDWNNSSQNIDGEITSSPNGSHVFYRGFDNYIHQQYSIGNGNWSHDWMICYDYLRNNLKSLRHISSASQKVYYEGSDNNIHIWEYGKNCNLNPNSTIEIPVDPRDTSSRLKNSRLTINVFPNPFKNRITIKGELLGGAIKVYNIMGECIYQKNNIKENILEIQSQSWKKGLYVITFKNSSDLFTSIKLIK